MSREDSTLVEKMVFALVEANISAINLNRHYEAVFETEFVLKQFRSLPLFYFIPLLFILYVFNFICSLSLKPFHKQTVIQREKLLQKYRRYSVPVLKDFLKFFDTLTVFAYYFYLEKPQLNR